MEAFKSMKLTRYIRRMDDLGRIIIPREIREKMNLKMGEPFEFNYTENSIVIKNRLSES